MHSDTSIEAHGDSAASWRWRGGRFSSILLAWVGLTIPLLVLIYSLVEPRYEATALLRVEPATPEIYGSVRDTSGGEEEVKVYLRTQVTLVESQNILDAALAKPEISRLKLVRESQDPKADLKKDMRVAIVGDNTYLIRVSLTSKTAAEAAAVVNAVVDEYTLYHGRYQQTANRNLRTTLESERKKIEAQIHQMKAQLMEILARSRPEGPVLERDKTDAQGPEPAVDRSLRMVTGPQYQEMTSSLIKVDFELMDARARLDAARIPDRRSPAEEIRKLESTAEEARKKRDNYRRYLAGVEVAGDQRSGAEYHVAQFKEDIQHLRAIDQVLRSKVQQIEFELGQEPYRITVEHHADVPGEPSENPRLRYMAAAPAGVLMLVLGASFLASRRARRADEAQAIS